MCFDILIKRTQFLLAHFPSSNDIFKGSGIPEPMCFSNCTVRKFWALTSNVFRT